MVTYTLRANIKSDSLSIIKAAQLNLTIIKSVNNGISNVIWVVVDPFNFNVISWKSEYGLYATPIQELMEGTLITGYSGVFPITDAATYTFDVSNTFKGPLIGGSPIPLGTYRVTNDMPVENYPALTFGLSQKLVVNSVPIKDLATSAMLLPSQLSREMTPSENIYVGLQSLHTSSTVITGSNYPDEYLLISFTDLKTDITVEYNPATGKFIEV